jgi:ferredoxin-like protein FixX
MCLSFLILFMGCVTSSTDSVSHTNEKEKKKNSGILHCVSCCPVDEFSQQDNQIEVEGNLRRTL